VTTTGTSAKLPAMTDEPRQKKALTAEHIAARAGGQLCDLLQQARHYQKLDRQLKTGLDPQMAEHCQVACIRGGRLLVLTPTPVWRTRLMLLSSELLSRLRNQGYPGLADIDIKVSPLVPREDFEKKPRELSSAARTSLSRFADACPDESLRAIARRMSDSS